MELPSYPVDPQSSCLNQANNVFGSLAVMQKIHALGVITRHLQNANFSEEILKIFPKESRNKIGRNFFMLTWVAEF